MVGLPHGLKDRRPDASHKPHRVKEVMPMSSHGSEGITTEVVS